MRQELKQVLDNVRTAMCLEIDSGVLDRLFENLSKEGTISLFQLKNCQETSIPEERWEIIVSCLKLCNDAAYEKLRHILFDIGQERFVHDHLPYAATVLGGTMPNVRVNMPCSEGLRRIIANNADQLVQIIEPDYELLEQLVKKELISQEQQQVIHEKPTCLERNYQLLTHLSKLDDRQCLGLSAALKAANQQHVANVLFHSSGLGDQELSSTFGDIRPLTARQRSIIDANYSSLISRIEPDNGFLKLLQIRECITPLQSLSIANSDKTEKNTRLLNILRRRSVRDYDEFVSCLNVVGRRDIAVVLSGTAADDQHHAVTVDTFDVKIPSERVLSAMRDHEMSYDVGYHPDNPSLERGRVLIIANTNVADANQLERSAMECDIANLKRIFSFLKFHINVKLNLTAERIRHACNKEKELQQQSSVFALCILSHGANRVVLGTDGGELSIDEIEAIFAGNNCKHLIGKPKLFIVQAGQEEKKTEGATRVIATDNASDNAADDSVPDDKKTEGASSGIATVNASGNAAANSVPDGNTPAQRPVLIAEFSDIALVLASPSGYTSDGSYFVRSLTEVLFEHAHKKHFMDMMAQVAHKMNELQTSGRCEVTTSIESTYRKTMYLLPY